MAEPIAIAPIDDAEAEVWRLTREVALLLTGLPWVLMGGLMVRAAEAERLAWEKVRDIGDHEIWSLDGLRVSVPRHREVNDLTAQGILRTLQLKLGKDWWR